MKSSKSQPKPSRKQRVRALYFEQGAEEAFTFGRRLQLQPSTLHSWIGTWRRQAAAAKAERTRARTDKKRAAKAQPLAEAKAELAKRDEPPIGLSPSREPIVVEEDAAPDP
jgi:transposase-like protein